MVLHRFLSRRLSYIRLSIQRQYQYSTSSEMQNAYISHLSGSDRFSLSFHYVNDSLGLDRKFNLNRQSAESVSSLLSRIQCNVEKIVGEVHAKKRRKAMKKNKEGSPDHDSGPVPQITVELLRGGNPVSPDETCQSFLEKNELLMLSLSGKKYHLVINPPMVDEIQLPRSILSNFPLYPSKFAGMNLECTESVFTWFKSKSPVREDKSPLNNKNEWQEVGSGFIYTPSTEDINHLLKVTCLPKKNMLCGPVAEAVAKNVVQAGPGDCPFELRHKFTAEKATGDCFRVMTYNILAGMYSDTDAAKNELFSHCPSYALDIDYRKQLLMKEIRGYNADIICLQEVDERVFECDLQPILSMEGYNGVFHKKGAVREGLACLVNSNRFRLVQTYFSHLSVELSERACYKKVWEAVKNNEALIERLKDRATSSQATVIQSVDNPKKWLVIGNTHLYFHPDADHVRLIQGGQTILFIEEIVNKLKEENPDAEVSIIMCGDFNSTPDCGVFRLMTTGIAPEDLVDWKSNEAEQISGLTLSQPFKLDSACGTPPFTNYTVGFSGCLDYIFYETSSLQVKEVFPLYSEEEVLKYIALPNIVFPSDHIALVSDIHWSQ